MILGRERQEIAKKLRRKQEIVRIGRGWLEDRNGGQKVERIGRRRQQCGKIRRGRQEGGENRERQAENRRFMEREAGSREIRKRVAKC
jgi:hypothetical protein